MSKYEISPPKKSVYEILPPINEEDYKSSGGVLGDLSKGASDLVQDVPVALLQGAAFDQADDLLKQANPAMGEKLEDLTNTAYERSPFFSTLASAAGGMATGSAAKSIPAIGKTVSNLVKGPLGSLVQGAGSAEEGSKAEGAIIGGGLHTVAQVTKALSKIPFSDPTAIRARSILGVQPGKAKRATAEGSKDLFTVADKLKEVGFFTRRDADFDIVKGKFVAKPGSDMLKMRAPGEEDFVSRSQDAIDKLNEENKRIVSNRKVKVPISEVTNIFENAKNTLTNSLYDKESAAKNIGKLQEIANLEYIVPDKDGMIDASVIEDIKSRLQKEASKNFGIEGDAPKVKEAYMAAANEAMTFLENKFGENYKRNNKLQSAFITAKGEIEKNSAGSRAMSASNPAQIGTGAAYLAGKAAEAIGGGRSGALIRADIGDAIEGVKSKEYIDQFLNIAPSRAIKPMREEVPVEPRINMNDSRNRMFYNESLLRTPFPRTTEEVMANPEFIISKLKLMAGPDMAEGAKEVLKNQPQRVPKLLAGIQAMFPQLLTDDKYNRIDNKITDPQLKASAIEDTMRDDRLSYTDKIARINLLNKTGEFHG
jgi:hypothetical protein